MPDGSASQDGYLKGAWSKIDYLGVYLFGGTFVRGDTPAWTIGGYFYRDYQYMYLRGGQLATGSQDSYLYGGVEVSSSLEAYIGTTSGTITSKITAFTQAVERASSPCYLEGLMTEYAYIILKSSDETINEKFRVIAQGYDDGTLEKAESLERTIGGGINLSQGAVYTTWNPTIRVRHTETVEGYGTLDELRQLYELNNPNGTPSNKITFIDHHGTSNTVYILGAFQKAIMGIKVEGEQAWYTVKLRLIKIQ